LVKILMGSGESKEVHHHHHHTVEKIVEKVIEKVVNIDKDRYERDQKILESILNNGFLHISESDNRSIMSIGPSGTGKSTLLNLFYKTEFKASISSLDVTQEMTPYHFDALNMTIVDTVGFLPTLLNVGKMFLLFFHRKFFPDYLVYPSNNDRIVDIISLRQLIDLGLIKAVIFPFNAKVFYALKKRHIPEAEAKDEALERDVIPEIQTFIRINKWEGHISIYNGENQSPAPMGSMKEVFLRTFFKDGKYRPTGYEEHMKNLKTNPNELLRGLLVDAINDLHNHAQMENDKIIRINECNFLKG